MRTQAESGMKVDSKRPDVSATGTTHGREEGQSEGLRASEGSGTAVSDATTTTGKAEMQV